MSVVSSGKRDGAASSEFKVVKYHAEDRVATITLNRPEKMNAMSLELCAEVKRAVQLADDDPEVRVVIVTGAGGKAFSAGYDLGDSDQDGLRGIEIFNKRLNHDLQYTYSMWNCSKPTIAMIDGYCLAGALELVQMCDIRYCSDVSRFGVVETRFSAGIATLAMPWVIGARSREFIYTGDMFGAEDALRVGLVNRVFPKADLHQEVMKIAKRMSRIALAALQWNKRAINNTYEAMGFSSALRYGVEACSIMDATETPEWRAEEDIRQAKGVTEALKWRKSIFAPYE
jgi:enoyl-CoA hydratase/carnithine racemase